MDIAKEVEVVESLKQAICDYRKRVAEANDMLSKAEDILADQIAEARLAGAKVSMIADSTGLNRQKVYMLLAMRGIRPAKEGAAK